MMYFHHRSVQLGNYCTTPQANTNLSKFTSVNYSSKNLLIVTCSLIFQKLFFMYKIEGNLGLLKQEQENQNNFHFVYKILRSGTVDAAQTWGNGVGVFWEICEGTYLVFTASTKKKENSQQQQQNKQIHPETIPKHCMRNWKNNVV